MKEKLNVVHACLGCGTLMDAVNKQIYCHECNGDFERPECPLCGTLLGSRMPPVHCHECREHLELMEPNFLFDPGHITATPRARHKVLQSEEEDLDLYELLERFLVIGDHGELTQEEHGRNYVNVKRDEGRIVARYRLRAGAIIYVTTEGDRSTTTLLTPQDW